MKVTGWEEAERLIKEAHDGGPGEAPDAVAQLALDMAAFELGDEQAGERLRQRAGGDTLDLRIRLHPKAAER
jgi:hypothetical protein